MEVLSVSFRLFWLESLSLAARTARSLDLSFWPRLRSLDRSRDLLDLFLSRERERSLDRREDDDDDGLCRSLLPCLFLSRERSRSLLPFLFLSRERSRSLLLFRGTPLISLRALSLLDGRSVSLLAGPRDSIVVFCGSGAGAGNADWQVLPTFSGRENGGGPLLCLSLRKATLSLSLRSSCICMSFRSTSARAVSMSDRKFTLMLFMSSWSFMLRLASKSFSLRSCSYFTRSSLSSVRFCNAKEAKRIKSKEMVISCISTLPCPIRLWHQNYRGPRKYPSPP